MNTIIALKGLVELLSNAAGITEQQAEEFVRAFSNTVRDGLKAGEMVRVKGIGIFGIDPITHKVTFAPDTELAEDANAPFSFFEEVELNPGVTDEILSNAEQYPGEESKNTEQVEEVADIPADNQDSEPPVMLDEDTEETMPETESEPMQESVPEPVSESIPEPLSEPVPESITEDVSVSTLESISEPAAESHHEPIVEPTEVKSQPSKEDATVALEAQPTTIAENQHLGNENKTNSETNDLEDMDAQSSEQNVRPALWWLIWAAVIGLLIGFAIGYFIHDPIQELFEPALSADYIEEYEIAEDNEAVESEDLINADAEVEAAETNTEDASAADNSTISTEPAPQEPLADNQANSAAAAPATVVYDEIRKNYFLANMAKKHYGYKDYWVYIYLENQDKISNPNMINIGTKLVVPPIEKYATQATQEEKIAAARKKASEIQAKFK